MYSWFCLPLQINDTLVTLPATTQIPGVSITTEDVYTIVTIKDEVQVKFESNNFLDIKIPASSNGKVRRETTGCVGGEVTFWGIEWYPIRGHSPE